MASNKLTKLNNLIRGDTPLLQFPITVNGVAANLTGYTVTFTATSNSDPQTGDVPLIQIPVAGDSTGIASFQLLNGGSSTNDTSMLEPGTTYYWDLQLRTGTGSTLRISTPLRGTFGVDADYNLSTT